MFSLEVSPPQLGRLTYNAPRVAEAVAAKLAEIYENRPTRVRAYLVRSMGFLPLRPDEEEACGQAAVAELERQFASGEARFEDGQVEGVDEQGRIDWRSILAKHRGR